MKQKVICLLAAVCMVLSLCGCESYDNFINGLSAKGETEETAAYTADSSDTVKIGIFEPLTGDDAQAASEEIAGIELAHSLYPTVLGKEVELMKR